MANILILSYTFYCSYTTTGKHKKTQLNCRLQSFEIFHRYKDGTELAGKTNNELSLTSLWSAAQGLYQCSAKLTADPSLPAVRSREARLTIRGNLSDKIEPVREKTNNLGL